MPGVHGLQHVERLATSTLADNDPVRTHAKSVAHQISNGDLASSFYVRRSSLEGQNVRLRQLQLGSVFDGDDALRACYVLRECVEEGRLARARATGHDDVL